MNDALIVGALVLGAAGFATVGVLAEWYWLRRKRRR